MAKNHPFFTALSKCIAAAGANVATLFLIVAVVAYSQLQLLDAELPEISILHNVQYHTPLTVYSRDGMSIAEFGDKKTIRTGINDIPQQLVKAFLAAEDDSFYTHPGIDYKGLTRATFQYLKSGQKRQGGSTITMQVARNFLLSSEKTFKRKIKEIILAFKIEREFSKQEILELYLNKIYLGQHAYGVAAAAKIYYGKSLQQLTLAETATLAGLPKAPSDYNPITAPAKSLQRRNYVLSRMLELGYISQAEFTQHSQSPSTASLHISKSELDAPYIAEMVRQEIFYRFGADAYTLGLKVFTTIDSKLQTTANRAIQLALHEYDERHGYRKNSRAANKTFDDLSRFSALGDTVPALVIHNDKNGLMAQLQNGSKIEISAKNMRWARATISSNQNSIIAGDIIRVRKLDGNSWALTQIPEAEGALVALNAENGAILALNGGFDFYRSKFNRATQSKRQPGSGFKPIIYTAALEQGYTVASMIDDAPLVLPGASENQLWRPENYGGDFLGPTSLRTALTKSRNLVSIRLLISVGLDKAIETAQRFGFKPEQLPRSYTLALGSGYASPLDMARLYAVFANGGFLITPYLIDRIETSDGKVIFQAKPEIACPQCDITFPQQPGYAPRVISPQINFLMNSLLRDVVAKGTATAAKVLDRKDLAGKTGTTNEQRDAWFNGFVPSLVATTWIGYDSMQPLGEKETGGHAALPMWIHFMREALQDIPEIPLNPPEGIIKAYINPHNGMLARENGGGTWEYFVANAAPKQYAEIQSEDETSGNEHDSAPAAQERAVESLF